MNRSVKTLLMLAIGYVTFFGAIIFSVSSEASVKPVGTFVPMACGKVAQSQPTKNDVPVMTEVCMGKIVGEPANDSFGAFEFKDKDGGDIYRVTEVSNLLMKLMSGATRAQVFMVGPGGDQASLKINRLKDGTYANASGQVGDATFSVPVFEPVYTTM